MTATAVAGDELELGCMLIPLAHGQLLLPSVCVAEILAWRRVRPSEQGPAWCAGLLEWRGVVLPVIRLEALEEAPQEAHGRLHPASRSLAVMNRTASGGPEFYALAAEAMPRLVQVTARDLDGGEAADRAGLSRTVRVGTESAWIPDLRHLEQRAAELG
ncbi:MAG: chemotaxis protein CheW [Pseudomonadota bacterium]